jgi:hypothetical protein
MIALGVNFGIIGARGSCCHLLRLSLFRMYAFSQKKPFLPTLKWRGVPGFFYGCRIDRLASWPAFFRPDECQRFLSERADVLVLFMSQNQRRQDEARAYPDKKRSNKCQG